MDTLKEMALAERVKGKEDVIPVFHDTFLDSIRRFGRQHELSMLLMLKLRTKDLFSDLDSGMKMLAKGKMGILPPKVKGAKEMKALFDRAEEASS